MNYKFSQFPFTYINVYSHKCTAAYHTYMHGYSCTAGHLGALSVVNIQYLYSKGYHYLYIYI